MLMKTITIVTTVSKAGPVKGQLILLCICTGCMNAPPMLHHNSLSFNVQEFHCPPKRHFLKLPPGMLTHSLLLEMLHKRKPPPFVCPPNCQFVFYQCRPAADQAQLLHHTEYRKYSVRIYSHSPQFVARGTNDYQIITTGDKK